VLGTGAALALVLVLVVSGLLIAGGPRSKEPPGRVHVTERIGGAYELTSEQAPSQPAPAKLVRGVEQAEVGFSLELLKNLTGSNDSSNELVSPSSLATALSMLELGAAGPTERAIAETLGSGGLSAGDQASAWHALAALLQAQTSQGDTDIAHVPELDVANALWIQQGLAVRSEFVRSLASQFRTGLWQVDFHNDLEGAIAAINQWTSRSTKGLIPQLFSPGALDQSTDLVLADAVYFRAEWARQFQSATRLRPFDPASGGTESVPFMTTGPTGSRRELTAPFSVTREYVAVELPYSGRNLSAVVVMPEQSSLSGFVDSLTPASLAQLLKAMGSAPIDLSMPTFTLRSDNRLNDVLASMGMSQAFENTADFTQIAPRPPLQVQSVEQHAYLQVTPKGTTAAAATGVGVQTSVARLPAPPIVIDHPFLFLVRDDTTGTILFESEVENPAA
jgi:serpin B